MKKILLLFFCLLTALQGWSQVDPPAMCNSDEQMKQFYKEHPAALQEALKFEERTRSGKNTTVRTGGYIIPVVFHVFGTDFAGKTVNDNTIITALEKANEDFNGLNDDYNTVSSLFQGIRATLDIEFKLAKIDPNGNLTTGINYYPERSGFGNGGGYDDQIRQFAWDNYKYMNVYIMLDLYDDNSYTNSGVAWYPNTWMSDNNLARVVYNGRYLYGNTDKEFASVLTHEFGHWLNLAHTFDNGCSAPGDNVDDTPATTANSGTCNVTTEKCSGAGIPNGENYMDYSNCYKMFTQGQVARMLAALEHEARFPLWQEANLAATGVNDTDSPFLLYSASVLHEDDANAGGIEGSVNISGQNGAAFAVTGALTQGSHFTTSNVPSGLSIQINVQNSTTATLSVSGNASAHANSDDVSNISITFLNPAIAGGTSSIQNPTFSGFSLNFKDPYSIVYEDITDITTNSSATWTFFELAYGDGRYGCWYDGGKLRLETYTKPLVCEGSTRNISLLASGTPISSNSNWVAGGPYPDEHDLRSASYTAWNGKTGYIGFKFTSPEGKNLHGWFRVTVNATGSSFTLHDYAYYTKPNGTIIAGSTTVSTPPVAAFTASATTVTAGQSVIFTDGSTGGATSWSWSFPGGTPATSTSQNPTVNYNTAGTYDVSLTVTNANGSDTETASGYITVNPASTTYCSSAGSRSTYEHIANVQIGSFSNPSGAANYSDYTHLTVDLSKGNSNALTLTPGFSGSTYSEYFRVWIDYNQDGDFADAGELAFDAGGTSTTAVSGTINVPSSALNGTTRMRVSMKYQSAPGPCGTIGDGEVEDYTVNISSVVTVIAPGNLTATATSSGSISLTWGDNSNNEDGFEIERSTGGAFNIITSTGANISSYTDNGLSANTTYSYRVRAKSGAVYSSYSNTSSATTPNAPSYCNASAGNPSGQYIKRVIIGSVDNSTSYASSGYSDYATMSANVTSSVTLTVTPHQSWAGTQARAWVDWNRDGDFSDSGEQVLSGSGSATSYSSTITPPAGTASGPVRLRVRVAYGEAPTACGSIYFSETEDYTLNIGTAAGPSASAFEQQLTLFPNPSKEGRFQLAYTKYEGDLDVSVYSLQGVLIHRQTFSTVNQPVDAITISINQNVRGTYLVHVKNNNTTIVRKVIFE
ncbi:M43 family zinc metalloprotease [Fulvivirga imtechensis]|nr:M43 family zinc metalloprotease [Fulvivirga imtechensis]